MPFRLRLTLILLCCLALDRQVHAEDSIMECVERGRVALSVAKAIHDEGYRPDQINFAFPLAAPEEQEKAQAMAEELKMEVIFALADKGTPELAAQAIMERCAYDYGKAHSNMRKTSHDEGVSNEFQYCYAYMKQLRAMFKEVRYSASMAVLSDYLGTDDAHDQAEIKALTDMVVKEELTKHPPEAESYNHDKADALVREIIGVDSTPQDWITKKWNACIADPYSVTR